jgi:murein DD-endopeptidase MepM/ murein hydrolase activator NlpD
MSEISVSINSNVKKGDILGKVGSTGRVTGPHLHWSVYLNKERINPESLLKENYLDLLLKASQNSI